MAGCSSQEKRSGAMIVCKLVQGMHSMVGLLRAQYFDWALSLDTLSRKLDARRSSIEIEFNFSSQK